MTNRNSNNFKYVAGNIMKYFPGTKSLYQPISFF